ncbi:MAG TPA: 8-oxo-dGTP diphosphatase [Patescibacteria group bacterium]|nr:8-oxo-dGTP diphosphatase [Patescibacteria group bacterium]
MTHVTLLFLQRDGELLLAMKKRGFGMGKWNGVGGKLESGESPMQAAIRECEEEIGVTPHNLQKTCELDFYLDYDADFNHFAHVYITEDWDGEPHETEEMRPKWFKRNALPYDAMWGDDKVWLPEMLAGKRFRGTFTLDNKDDILHSKMVFITNQEEFTT